MNLLLKVAIVIAIVAAMVALGYFGVMLMTWRELKHARVWHQRCERELKQLENAHGSITQAIDLIQDGMAECDGVITRFQEKKLAEMQAALAKNEQKILATQEQLEKYQDEVGACEEALRHLKAFAWLKKR